MTDLAQAIQEPEATDWLESLDWETPAPAAVIFSVDPKKEQAALVKTIGARMREARELCNLSQSEAASQFGYANPSKLSKVEGATDTNSVPMWLIVRAARIYEVSIDYLFGLTDDWEIGVPRGAQSWLLEAWNKARLRDLATLDRLHREITYVSQHTTELVTGIADVAQALTTWRERNPSFDETPASATVAGRTERLQERARTTEAALKKFQSRLRLGTGSE